MVKKGLGKGVSALIKEDAFKNINNQKNILDKNKIIEVDINEIQPDEKQPRKSFDQESLEELAKSIKTVGVISPIIVRKKGEFYEIITGERRWRSCRIAGIRKVPVIVREYSELEKVEISLIENIQRENLNPIEEAIVYKKLQEEFELNQEEIADRVGKNRTTITNSIRLLKLDERVQNLLIEQKISVGHARTLLSVGDKDTQFDLAQKIIEEKLNVRQVENLIKSLSESLEEKNKEIDKNQQLKNEAYEYIKKDLNQIFGTKVNIKNGKNKGKIEIEYYSENDLDRIYCFLKNKLGD